MLNDPLLAPARKLPWIKIVTSVTGITVGVAGGVYLWTSKRDASTNQIELTQRDVSRLQLQKEYSDKKIAERKKCEMVQLQNKKEEKPACFKEH